jgi:hypothetical protein
MAEQKTFTPEAAERLIKKLADWDKPVDPVESFAGKGFRNNAAGARKHPNYAHFPGTGPAEMSCGSCRFLGDGSRCGKFQELTGNRGNPISPSAISCKYFQIRARK